MKFENMVVGQFNEMAVRTLEMVLQPPEPKYPILILLGRMGLGKSTLVHTIQNEVEIKRTIKLTTGNSLMNELVEAIVKKNNSLSFHEKIQDIDIFIIDDFQQVLNKTTTQEFILNIFKNRFENNKQTIITSSIPIDEIPGINKELVSFLQSALMVEIQTPSLGDKLLITKHVAKERNICLYDDVAMFVAESCGSNLREIQGAVIKLDAIFKIYRTEITLETAKEHLGR